MLKSPIFVQSACYCKACIGGECGSRYIARMEKSSKLPRLPLVLTANDLRGGGVVYFDGEAWVSRLSDAVLAEDEATARQLEQVAADSAGLVVDAYLVSAAKGESGEPVSAHYREQIRSSGPTISFGEEA
tara:strand:- start:50 stop:439 length:390 start_codon:yes stop_codon:yes gene_type:complete